MSGSTITNFAFTPPAPPGGTSTIALPEIRVGPEPNLGGGALPGDGSYGDPITGFRQINQQFADSQREFSARMDAQSAQFNAQLQAQGEARAAQMQARFDSNMASMDAQRAAQFAAPPVMGPILPPDFLQTAQAPPALPPMPAPAFGLDGPIAPADAAAAGTIGLGQPAFGLGGPVAPDGTPVAPAANTAADQPLPQAGDGLSYRGAVLPIGVTTQGDLVPALPGFLKSVVDGLGSFNRVLDGEVPVYDPMTGGVIQEAIESSLTLSGLAVTGGVGGVAVRQGELVLGAGLVRPVANPALAEARLGALTRGEISAQEALAARRVEFGLPPAGAPNDNATLSLLAMGGRAFEGINRGLQNPARAMTLDRVNAQTVTHAEADVVQQAIDAGLAGTVRRADMTIDRAPCTSCGKAGGLRSLARNLGVDELHVTWPGGQQTFTPTK
ncbi:deaminase [Methylobacterium aquaticum]|uniref:deaminase n=1 Tax=Methylobacterium aquaticum TaxID=270351 RepID=UPI0009E3C1DD|nr:deaminase [Methylobacterium aquaticum]